MPIDRVSLPTRRWGIYNRSSGHSLLSTQNALIWFLADTNPVDEVAFSGFVSVTHKSLITGVLLTCGAPYTS